MKKIIIFGTGSVAEVLAKNIKNENCVVAYVNSNESVNEFHGKTVIRPDDIHKYEYDYIIVASGYYLQIEGLLLDLGISQEKIIGYIFDEEESYENMAENLDEYLDKRYNRRLLGQFLNDSTLLPALNASVIWKNNALTKVKKDFVREQTVALMASEIQRKRVSGAVAELGVFRGDFTTIISKVFSDKKLYLFDTFAGFETNDVEADESVENNENELLKFKDTSVEYVLSRLVDHTGEIQVKKGWFPETFDLDEENFSFVSIDLNMYTPVKKALELFYPRMSKGGYIMISDYNAPFYEGTSNAIREFCEENNINFLPIPDLYGSAIICK